MQKKTRKNNQSTPARQQYKEGLRKQAIESTANTLKVRQMNL